MAGTAEIGGIADTAGIVEVGAAETGCTAAAWGAAGAGGGTRWCGWRLVEGLMQWLVEGLVGWLVGCKGAGGCMWWCGWRLVEGLVR